MEHSYTSGIRLPIGNEMPSLNDATGWLNTKPLKPADLKGKVVLIDFCTYTCINWLRTLPYIRAWATKYKDKGLLVIGVHTPEFSFEIQVDNVRQALRDMNIDYPIALDNNYAIWRAFNNAYWPALYFIDAQGRIRHHQFGEGDYERSEKIIQQLLAEAGAKNIDKETVSGKADGIEAAADWNSLQSNENYLGYEQTQNFSSPGKIKRDKNSVFVAPEKLPLNHWTLIGEWTINNHSAVLNKTNGKIRYSFHARDLHLVMGVATPGSSVKFRILIDGLPPGEAHGNDIDDEGYGFVSKHRLYQLIRQPGSIIDRQFEIEFYGLGIEAFAFTFG